MAVIIVALVRPPAGGNRPASVGGGPLQAGDIFVHQMTGARDRYDGAAWQTYAPEVIYAVPIPTVRPAANGGGPLQDGDIWVQQTTGIQARRDGGAWLLIELGVGVPDAGLSAEHLAKAALRPFDTEWVDPADGIAYLHRQQTPSDTWVVLHGLRSTWVAVTAIDDTRGVQMIPDITYDDNRCDLHFQSAVSGYCVVHASKPVVDATV